MKKTIFVFMLLPFIVLNAQNFNVFKANAVNYPVISAKFYIFDKDGNQVYNQEPADFEIREGGEKREILRVSCPLPKPVQRISSVLTVDVSGSMGGLNMEMAKKACRLWVNSIPLGKSECALTSFDSKNYMNQDFTTDKEVLLEAVEKLRPKGGTDFNAGFIDPKAGALLAAEKGRHKKVIVFLTDGRANAEENAIIQKAKEINAVIYCVVLNQSCPYILKEISEETGGFWFENISTEKQAEEAYIRIFMAAQGGEPCTIEWETGVHCFSGEITANISFKTFSLDNQITYKPPKEELPRLKITPSGYSFKEIEPGEDSVKKLTVTAEKKDFSVTDIISTNPLFSVSPRSFFLEKGKSIELTVSYSPEDSSYNYCRMDIKAEPCDAYFYLTGGIPGYNSGKKGLRIIKPNGGEKIPAGSISEIEWEGILPQDTVTLRYSRNAGKDWVTIEETASGLKYLWENVPPPGSDSCIMEVSLYEEKKLPDMLCMGFGTAPVPLFRPNSTELLISNINGVWIADPATSFITNYQPLLYSQKAAFSFDGLYLLVYNSNLNQIWVMDADSYKKLVTIYVSNAGNMTCSPVDDRFVLTGNTALPEIYSYTSGEKLITLEKAFDDNSEITDAAWKPDGTQIAGVKGNYIILWDALSGKVILRKKFEQIPDHPVYGLNDIKWSPDGKYFAASYYRSSGLNNTYVINSDSINIKYIISGNASPVWSLDGKDLYTVKKMQSYSYGIEKCDAETGNVLWTSEDGFPNLGNLSISSAGNFLAVSSYYDLKIFNTSGGSLSGTVYNNIDKRTGGLENCGWSSNNSKILTVNNDAVLFCWDAASGNPDYYENLDSRNFGFSVNPAKSLAAIGVSGAVIIYDYINRTTKNTIQLEQGSVRDIAFSPDGNKLAGCYHNLFKLWDENGNVLLDFDKYNFQVYTFAWSPDGKKIATNGKNSDVMIWDAETGELLKEFGNTMKYFGSIHWSGDGSKIAYSLQKDSLYIYETENWSRIAAFDDYWEVQHSRVRFSPGGSLLASANNRTISIWDMNTLQKIEEIHGYFNHITDIKWNEDGSKLAGCSYDGTLKIWNIEDEKDIKKRISDESDSLWSIAMPEIQTESIDMGRLTVGSMKDSVITGYIKNTGSYKTTIKNVSITGNAGNNFAVVSNIIDEEIAPGESRDVEFRFIPQQQGSLFDKVNVNTTAGAFYGYISGEGIEKTIEISDNIIDFGRVYLGIEKDTTISAVIKNISSERLDIKNVFNGGPDNEQFKILSGGGSFTLQPEESREMKLRFKSKHIGRTSGELEFEFEGTGSPAKVQLFAEGYKFIPKLSTNAPVCEGDNLEIFAEGVPDGEFFWKGPDGFSSSARNVLIKNALPINSGQYSFFAEYTGLAEKTVYSDTAKINILVAESFINPGDSSFIFTGEAKREDEFIKLTEARLWNGGSVWLKNKFSVLEDFQITFAFQTRYGDNGTEHHENSVPGADGIAFVMQNHNYPILGDFGKAIGYAGIRNSIAVEIDLFQNPYDPDGNHVAVQSLGPEPNSPVHELLKQTLGISTEIPEIIHDKTYWMKIEYIQDERKFKVYLSDSRSMSAPILTIEDFVLSDYLLSEGGEYVFLGVTAGTGKAWQEHLVFDWQVPCKNQFLSVREFSYGRGGEISIYPNPCNEFAEISLSDGNFGTPEISVSNLFGRKLSAVQIKQTSADAGIHYRLNTSELAPGIYFITVKSGGSRITETLRVVR